MGFPVTTIKDFEYRIKERPKPWVLILLANGYSDSKAIKVILDNFHLLDKISREADFFLPGYSFQGVRGLRFANDILSYEYSDFHVKMQKTVTCDLMMRGNCYDEIEIIKGPYCGIVRNSRQQEIVFNLAEYTDFVMEFISLNSKLEYLGGAQMILMPITSGRTPDYKNMTSYDLDEVIFKNYPLEKFLTEVLNLINRDLQGNLNLSLRHEIDECYWKIVEKDNLDKYKIILSNHIFDMERCLGWKLSEDYYFISYSSKNVRMANHLYKIMTKEGLKVWIAPEGIPQGCDYSMAVPTALRKAKNFILLLSATSAVSTWVIRELDMAINQELQTKIKILLTAGFSLEDIRNNNQLTFYLNRIQIKYKFEDIVESEKLFNKFIQE